MRKKLPENLSDGILLALEDLEAVEKSKRYEVDMGVWHVPLGEEEKCYVCLAGAVMAQTLKYSPSRKLVASELPQGHKLVALDRVRVGNVEEALGLWSVGFPLDAFKISLRDGFWRQIQENLLAEGVVHSGNEYPPPTVGPARGSMYVPEYSESKRGFKSTLRKIARALNAGRAPQEIPDPA